MKRDLVPVILFRVNMCSVCDNNCQKNTVTTSHNIQRTCVSWRSIQNYHKTVNNGENSQSIIPCRGYDYTYRHNIEWDYEHSPSYKTWSLCLTTSRFNVVKKYFHKAIHFNTRRFCNILNNSNNNSNYNNNNKRQRTYVKQNNTLDVVIHGE